MKYIALLIEININSKNKVSMKELKTYIEKSNYENNIPYLNIGNIIIDTNQKQNKIEKIKEYSKTNWLKKTVKKHMTIITDNTIKKVLKIAKQQAKKIEKQVEELVDYAIEKGTPVLEKAASSVREKAIVVTKEVLAKLEQEEKAK